jgi:serine phosphatase RsbU (regulator of sigma subunit)
VVDHEVTGAAAAWVVQQVLAVLPAGCTWLLPVRAGDGQVVDFRVAAASTAVQDIYGRGTDRVSARLAELYPAMVDGPLWRMYHQVLTTGVPGRMPDFRYDEQRSGVVAHAAFDVRAHPLLDGLLVWWQRVDEDRRRLAQTELLGRLGWAEYDLATGRSMWSSHMYRIFERDPELGPMPRAEQTAIIVPEDRGLREAAWQALDSAGESDVTMRFKPGTAVKYLRIMSHVDRDADGAPLKIYALVQDVTAREDSRTEIERLSQQLRSREITALAEHRLAAQLQNMIQPVPREPFQLAGMEAMVGYLPAESAAKVGGDWYHAQDLPDGQVALAVGDVAGHGLEAANGMAHLRYALIAWLSSGIRDPGTLLGHLNRLCAELRITGTAVVGIYETSSGVLRWARAGHMPPLLARAGQAGPLDHPDGLLLGADRDVHYPIASPVLRTGDVVLFYTDGLLEGRAAERSDVLREVTRSLAELSAAPGGQSLARVSALLNNPSPHDDTCTLALRVLP